MLAEDILNLEKISYKKAVYLKVENGKIKEFDAFEIPLNDTSTLGDLVTNLVDEINKLKALKDNVGVAMESLKTLGACTTLLSEQIEVLNEEVNK